MPLEEGVRSSAVHAKEGGDAFEKHWISTSLGAAWGRKGVNCSCFGKGCDVDGVRRGTFHFPAALGWHVSPDPAANTDCERPDFQPSTYKTSPEPVSIYFLSLSPPPVCSLFFPPLRALFLCGIRKRRIFWFTHGVFLMHFC